jgi:hypothetical protein
VSWALSHYLIRYRFLQLKQKLQAVLRIRITDADPEPFLRRSGSDFSFDADPDPAFHFDAYPAFSMLRTVSESDFEHCCGSGSATLVTSLFCAFDFQIDFVHLTQGILPAAICPRSF